jgi:hypothetical protein
LTALNHKVAQLQAKAKDADDPSVYFDILDGLAADRKAAVARLKQAKTKVAYETAAGLHVSRRTFSEKSFRRLVAVTPDGQLR